MSLEIEKKELKRYQPLKNLEIERRQMVSSPL